MRMWMVPPRTMCRRHLLGEHVEIHMFLGAMRLGTSMAGYCGKANLMEPAALFARHALLADEMLARGYNHFTELSVAAVAEQVAKLPPDQQASTVNVQLAMAELHRRCPECLNRWKENEPWLMSSGLPAEPQLIVSTGETK